MKNNASIFLAAAMSLSLTVGSATPAVAGQRNVTVVAEQLPDDVLTRSVSYADLNLAATAGVKTLNGRVKRAVRYVCAPLDQLHTRGDHSECRSFAWNGAKYQMDLAVERAEQLASQGFSSIAPVAIVIAAPAD